MNDPPVIIELDCTRHDPGATLTGRYLVDPDITPLATSIEVAVYWMTVGKGGEDRAYQYKQIRSADDGTIFNEGGTGSFALALPSAPLSYDGVLLKIFWYVRVRLTLAGGAECERSTTFRLGRVAAVTEVVESPL